MRRTPKWCRAIRTRASPSTEASNDGPTGESTRLAAARPPSRRLEHRSVRQSACYLSAKRHGVGIRAEADTGVGRHARGGKGRVVLPAPEETKLSRGGSARVALPTAEARRGVQHHQRRPAGSLGGGWRPLPFSPSMARPPWSPRPAHVGSAQADQTPQLPRRAGGLETGSRHTIAHPATRRKRH